MTTPKRTPLGTVGNDPHTVNVWTEKLASGRKVARIEWRDGRRHTKTWDDTAEGRRLAKAYAKGVNDKLKRRGTGSIERIAISVLFDKFLLSQEQDWRPKTRTGAVNKWRLFQMIVGSNTFADLVSEETLDEVRRALRTRKLRPIAPNQIQKVIAQVKKVWSWARRRKLLAENPLAEYENKLPKDGKALDVPEYSPEEAARMIAKLSYRSSRTWRTWAAVVLGALLGPRENALLNLEWPDVDFSARTVRWRPELDKLGRDRVQPLPREAVFAFRVCRIWAERLGYSGRYIFFTGQRNRRGEDEHWTYSTLNQQILKVEIAARVEHVKFRSMHGLRRHAAKNILTKTGGDLNAAGDWIGDKDPRTLKRSYIKERPEEMRGLANLVSVLPRKAAHKTMEARPEEILETAP